MNRFLLIKTSNAVFLLLLFFFASKPASAQLTFNDTVIYLESCASNIENLTKKYDDTYTYRITDIGLGTYKDDPKKLLFEYTRKFSDNTEDKIQFIFNPKYIESYSKETELSTNGFHFATIKLSGNFVLKVVKQSSVKDYTQDSFSFPYIAGDPLAFERMKAAFHSLKLKSLVKDTDDPFAN